MIIPGHLDRIWSSSFAPGYHALLNLDRPRGVAVVNDRLYLEIKKGAKLELPDSLMEALGRCNIPSGSWRSPELALQPTAACWVHVTNACNLACDYCYINKTPDRMTHATATDLVGALRHTIHENGLRKLRVSFAGGEPSLNLGVIRQICSALSSEENASISYSLTTNATVVSPELLRLLSEFRFRVYVSLDGVGLFNSARRYRDGKSSFQDAGAGLQLLTDGVGSSRVGVGIVVSPANVLGLPQTTEFLLERKLRFKYSFYRPNPVATLRWPDNIAAGHSEAWARFLDNLESRLRSSLAMIRKSPYSGFNAETVLDKFSVRGGGLKQPCTMGTGYFAVGWNGEISRCHMLQNESGVGSIGQQSRNVLSVLANAGPPPSPFGSLCQNCEIIAVCRAGCRLILDRAGASSIYHDVFWSIFPDYVDTIAAVQLATRPQTVSV